MPSRRCTACSHPFDPHVLVPTQFTDLGSITPATYGQPREVPVAGVMFCPACDCCTTWSVSGWPRPEMPPEREAGLLREMAC